jgi:putative membrane protein
VRETEVDRVRQRLHPTVTASSANAANPNVPTVTVPLPPPERTILQLTPRLIVTGALTGAGLLSAPLGVLAIIQFLDETNLKPDRLPVLGPIVAVVLGSVALLAVPIASALVSLARNGGWNLTESAGQLRIQRATPLRRKLGLAAIDLTTAAPAVRGDNEGAGSADDDIPIVPAARLAELEQLLVPASASVDELTAHPRAARRRAMVRRFYPIIPLAIGLTIVNPAAGVVGLVGGATVAYLLGAWSYRRMRYGASATALITESGSIGWKRHAIALVKVQSVEITQSPFQRRADLATLNVHLALAGVQLRDVATSEAYRLASLVDGITITR